MREFFSIIKWLFKVVFLFFTIPFSIAVFSIINENTGWNIFVSAPVAIWFFWFCVWVLIKDFSYKNSRLNNIASKSSPYFVFLLQLKEKLIEKLSLFSKRVEVMNKLEISTISLQEDALAIHDIIYAITLYKQVIDEIFVIYKTNTTWLEKKDIFYEESIFWLYNSYSISKYQSFLEKEKESFISQINSFSSILDLRMEKHKWQLEEVEKSIQKIKSDEGLPIGYKKALDMSEFRFHNYIQQVKSIT